MWVSNPHLLSHDYRIVLLEHLGATPVSIRRLSTLATDSPAGTNEVGDPVSAASEVVGAGYQSGGVGVTLSVDTVGDTSRLLCTSATWLSLTANIRGALLVNRTLEDGGSLNSVLVWQSAAETIVREGEPLRISFGESVLAVLPRGL